MPDEKKKKPTKQPTITRDEHESAALISFAAYQRSQNIDSAKALDYLMDGVRHMVNAGAADGK